MRRLLISMAIGLGVLSGAFATTFVPTQASAYYYRHHYYHHRYYPYRYYHHRYYHHRHRHCWWHHGYRRCVWRY
jgi:hypothetical protein